MLFSNSAKGDSYLKAKNLELLTSSITLGFLDFGFIVDVDISHGDFLGVSSILPCVLNVFDQSTGLCSVLMFGAGGGFGGIPL